MAANDYSMGKYMQSQQNPCKLDGLGKSKYRAGQKMNINQMIYGCLLYTSDAADD